MPRIPQGEKNGTPDWDVRITADWEIEISAADGRAMLLTFRQARALGRRLWMEAAEAKRGRFEVMLRRADREMKA